MPERIQLAVSTSIQLKQTGDAIFAQTDPKSDWVEVKIVYARPVSNRDGQISILNLKSKEEIAWVESLETLPEKFRTIAQGALDMRYPMSIIENIESSDVNHGHRYLKVNTNRGFRYFNLKEPGQNVTWLSSDHLVIRDSMGNRYEVPSIEALDAESKQRLDRVL